MIKFVLILLCSLFTTSNASAKDLEGEVIILIGDSQMEGKWGTMGTELEKILETRGAKVVRLGVGASGSKFWNKTLDGERTRLSKKRTVKWTLKFIKELKPTQIIVSLGGNNSAIGGYGKHYKSMERYHRRHTLPLMRKLKEVSKVVVWFGPAHRWTSVKGKKRKKVKRGRVLTNRILRECANQTQIKYFSMLNWASRDERLKDLTPKEIRYDGVHYKNKGKNKTATWYAEMISKDIRMGDNEI